MLKIKIRSLQTQPLQRRLAFIFRRREVVSDVDMKKKKKKKNKNKK